MKKNITILAIETSCDETSAAVIYNGKILSNIIASQIKIHAKYGGVVPEVAAREHVSVIIPVINQALRKAKVKLKDIDYIAVTQGPGLITSLMVGIDTAQTIALALQKSLIPVNHMEGHVYANFVGKNPAQGEAHPDDNQGDKIRNFPAIILIVSGGHTMLVLMKAHGKYQIVGETVDDAAGEAFDKTAKLLGLPYPGGPHLSRLAQKGNLKAYNFPRPMINSDNLDFSFSGLKTSVLYKIEQLKFESASDSIACRSKNKNRLLRQPKVSSQIQQDLAASIQAAIVDVLIAKTEKAIDKYHPKLIMLGGGVAANNLLRKRFEELAKQSRVNYSIPALQDCTDNAGMIGLSAFYRIKHNKAKPASKAIPPKPHFVLK